MEKISSIILILAGLFSTGADAQEKRNLKQEERNRKTAIHFINKLLGDKDVSDIDAYVAEDYIQHNPDVTNGRAAFKEAVAKWFAGVPKEKVDIRNVAAEGNLVFLHIKAKRNGKDISIVDIFRFENGIIVEHWDVIQEVPEKSVNPHPMF